MRKREEAEKNLVEVEVEVLDGFLELPDFFSPSWFFFGLDSNSLPFG
jgi:hypothetical protein